MNYLITILITLIVGFIIDRNLFKKESTTNKDLEAKYKKAMQEIQTLKNRIKDAADEETPSTIDTLINSLNE